MGAKNNDLFNHPILSNSIPLTNYQVAALTKAKLQYMESKYKENVNNAGINNNYKNVIEINKNIHHTATLIEENNQCLIKPSTLQSELVNVMLTIDNTDEKVHLTPHEIVALINFKPSDYEEAIFLIPSLSKYSQKDINNIIVSL